MKSQSAAKLPEAPVMRPVTESPTVLEVPQPTLYKYPLKAKKPKANDTS